MFESNITSAYNTISSKGVSVSIKKKTLSAYDVDTGVVGITQAVETGYAVVVKYDFGNLAQNDKFTAHEELLTIILAAQGITRPYVGDIITLGVADYIITQFKTIAPNYDEPIIYIVELKK